MDDFALDLILADEQRRRAPPDDPEPEPRRAEQSVVIERTDFTARAPFVIGDDRRTFPLFGVGSLDSLLLITDSKEYEIHVETDADPDRVGADESVFLDGEAYADLERLSTELGSVAAYENANGEWVLEVGPVQFLDSVRAWVEPTDPPLSVRRQRAEVTVETEVS